MLRTVAESRDLCPQMRPSFALCFEGRISSELRGLGVPVHMLPEVTLRRPWTVIRTRASLKALLQREQFDVVITHNPWVHGVFGPVAESIKSPLAVWIHGAAQQWHWVEMWARQTAPDLFICNSRFTAEAVSKTYGAKELEVIYCPLAVRLPSQPMATRAALRNELGVNEQDVVILQASRLDGYKGHAILLQSLSRLKDLPGWTCWIAGGDAPGADMASALKSEAAQLGLGHQVRFLGERSDVPELLTAADILCQPNIGPEPFGLVLVEALAAGLPVVTSALGGAMEVVDNSCGILTEPGNATQLSESLKFLIENPEQRRRLQLGGRGRAQLLCDPALRLKQLCGTLESLVSSHKLLQESTH